MPILKTDIQVPVLPDEKVVSVPELGGEVIVRPLTLSDRLAFAQESSRANGQTKDFAHIATLLTHTVVDANHEHIFTTAQWEAWGALHIDAALKLWDQAWDISGLDQGSAEKKSKAQNSNSQ